MLEEALPIAVGVGAALLPALAFGGVAAARSFIYLAAGACTRVCRLLHTLLLLRTLLVRAVSLSELRAVEAAAKWHLAARMCSARCGAAVASAEQRSSLCSE